MWPGTSTSLSWHGFPSIFQIVSFLVFPLRFPGFWSWQWVTIVLWMRNLFAPSCLLDSSDKTQWPFLQTRDTGCVGGSASTSLWSEAVMVHFPRWNDQNEICKEKKYWNGKSWATSAACTSTKVVPMHTIQSMCVEVDMNVITPIPPHPNPKWKMCILYHIIYIYIIIYIYCRFLQTWMVLVSI